MSMKKRSRLSPIRRLRLGESIKAARVAAGFDTQLSFALALGKDASSVKRVESGKVTPSVEFLHEAARVCGITVPALIGDSLDAPEEPAAAA